MSVGTGCKATLIGFDHGGPGKQTGNPITGGGGTVLDLSNPPKLSLQYGERSDSEIKENATPMWMQLAVVALSAIVLLLALAIHDMHNTLTTLTQASLAKRGGRL